MIFSVSDVNAYIKDILESDVALQDVWVEGEISNLRVYKLGKQVYFNVIDPGSQLNCVVFSTFLKNIPFELEDGLKVHIRGKVKHFHKRGTYSLQVHFMALEGEGDLSQNFDQLKEKLLKEGLFDPSTKKDLPRYTQTIALITATDSAAMIDITRILSIAAPHIDILHIPATMQGDQCPPSVKAALEVAESLDNLDAILIARGGGGTEDLAGFNNESLVRRIHSCETPIISAIGHEIDYTLTDFVSDLRLPTPTAAAQLLATPYIQFKDWIQATLPRLGTHLQYTIQSEIQDTHESLAQISKAISSRFTQLQDKTTQLIDRTEKTNPIYRIKQGYAVCRTSNNQVIQSQSDVNPEDKLQIQVQDGLIDCTVTDTHHIIKK